MKVSVEREKPKPVTLSITGVTLVLTPDEARWLYLVSGHIRGGATLISGEFFPLSFNLDRGGISNPNDQVQVRRTMDTVFHTLDPYSGELK